MPTYEYTGDLSDFQSVRTRLESSGVQVVETCTVNGVLRVTTDAPVLDAGFAEWIEPEQTGIDLSDISPPEV